jgi:hypothetical protein
VRLRVLSTGILASAVAKCQAFSMKKCASGQNMLGTGFQKLKDLNIGRLTRVPHESRGC